MSLFFWKKHPAIDSFANNIANDLFSTIQPQVASDYFGGKLDKKQSAKIEKALNNRIQELIIKIKDFKAMNSLGFYGKARLHMKFKERLIELGYNKKIVEDWNHFIMIETP